MSLSSAIRNSDRKASRILGVTITRDYVAPTPEAPKSIVHALRNYFRSTGPVNSDRVVLGVPNPFAAPSPGIARLQAEFAPHEDDLYRSENDTMSIQDDPFGDEVGVYDGEGDPFGDEDDIFDGEEADVQDNMDEGTLLVPIVPSRLSPVPFHSSPSPSPPPPTPVSSYEEEGKASSLSWADLAHVHDGIAEAAERAARKAKRDAHRSRSQTLGSADSPALFN